MEITKTVLSLMLVVITILTTLTLTTTIAAYAGGDDDDDDRDGNKQKAKDESQAALADCDENDVKRAGFDCISIAESEVEIEQPEEPPEESATLFVCKEVEGTQEFIPFNFGITITPISGGGSVTAPGGPIGDPDPDCQEWGRPGEVAPGEYEVLDTPDGGVPPPDRVEVEGDCTQDLTNQRRATVEIQEGETLTCTFTNIYEIDG